MIRRVVAALLLVWLLGFAGFSFMLPGPAGASETDAVIVLTGGENRLDRGLEILEAGKARRMLVSGVNRTVRPIELAEGTGTEPRLFECCIDLDQDSVDTRSNGDEAARWIREHRFRSVRIVTTDWHMPRARYEVARHFSGHELRIVADSVPSEPSLMQLFLEYNKYVLRRLGVLVGV